MPSVFFQLLVTYKFCRGVGRWGVENLQHLKSFKATGDYSGEQHNLEASVLILVEKN